MGMAASRAMANPMYASALMPIPQMQEQQQAAEPQQQQQRRPPQQRAVQQQPQQTKHTWVRDHADFLQALLRAAGDEAVDMQLERFAALLVDAAGPAERPPVGHFVAHMQLVGSARTDAASFHAALRVAVAEDEWTVCPLFSKGCALVSAKVSPEKGAVVGVVGDWYSLVAAAAGEYTVELELLVPYATQRRTGLQFSVPRAAQSELRFSVPQRDVLIKVDPALFSETTSAPAATGEEEATSVRCLMPPTASLSVQWTEKLGEAKEKAKDGGVREKVVATVEQTTLCSIGEGYLLTWTRLHFAVTSGQMSVYCIELDPRVRVLNVEGLKNLPVKRWDVEKLSRPSIFAREEDKPADSASTAADGKKKKHHHQHRPQAQQLTVFLEYGLEDFYDLTLVCELPLTGETSTVLVPGFACIAECPAHQITREKGFIAVEARANVEVREAVRKGAGRIDTSELPEMLWSVATNPPLLAYKFAAPSACAISLGIQKHENIPLLEAAADAAHYMATVTEEGRTMFMLTLAVRNSQRQFLRIQMPKGAEVWSTQVDGDAVKPATDRETGAVMVPMKKAGASSASATSTVSFTYMLPGEPLPDNGAITLNLPRCDLPISKLFVSCYMPSGRRYGEFDISTHAMREVRSFSETPPAQHSSTTAMGGGASRGRRKMAVKKMKAAAYDDFYSGSGTYEAGTSAAVAVDLPTTPTVFRFEQLICMPSQDPAVLTVSFARVNRSRQNRHL